MFEVQFVSELVTLKCSTNHSRLYPDSVDLLSSIFTLESVRSVKQVFIYLFIFIYLFFFLCLLFVIITANSIHNDITSFNAGSLPSCLWQAYLLKAKVFKEKVGSWETANENTKLQVRKISPIKPLLNLKPLLLYLLNILIF